MSCSVNLVPAARVRARAFARRCRAWVVICAGSALLVGVGWSAQYLTGRALARLHARTSALEGQRAAAQQRLAAADERRAQLTARLKLIAAARREQPWAARLAELARTVPEGVFLTQLNISPKPSGPEGLAVAARGAASAGQAPAQPAVTSPAHDVRLMGYALDHAALIQLLNTLQASPDWQQVELVRATSEPYAGQTAVAFEFDCRSEELPP
jgi:Tfp pilus assembly protein PilN